MAGGTHIPVLCDMVTPMKTTIEIADDLLRAAKEQARKERTTLRALVESGLRRELKERRARRGKPRFKLVTFKGDGLQPGIDFRNWEQIRSIIYEGHGG